MASEHSAATRRYLVVWLSLLALTGLSWLLSTAHLGSLDVVLALLIAFAKTTLVLLFFMHLLGEGRTVFIVPILCLGYVGLLVALVASDVATRHTFPPAVLPDVTGR